MTLPQSKPIKSSLLHPGIVAAVGSAILFGSGTPLAKVLLGNTSPWLMAALLYLGSGIGITLYRTGMRSPPVHLPHDERYWLVGAILTGGVLGPGLLMLGLSRMPASGASLLLNGESVFTALLAWFVFRENFDRRVAFGMAAILAGMVVLSWPGEARFAGTLPSLLVLGACVCWAVDNNLTRKLSLNDATWLASIKELVAGSVNLALAMAVGARWPGPARVAESMVVGLFAYGASLTFFVVGLRNVGTARTGAYFSTAPFIGAVLSIAFLHEQVTLRLLLGGGLMASGLWLHLTERHSHQHAHPAVEHDHEHTHDAHHQHLHPYPVAPGVSHNHPHRHEPMTHTHEHYPDAHHQHGHED